ncbi:B-cell receptor CD22-like [Oncorhynchus masou masou]|uniref:B-cell receptor CD22-like n=1 Tax=Oncorhynchus masou masou TaxID=90313 RepID=UPI003182CFDD
MSNCVSVVLGQNVWSVTYTKKSICALKGSTVEMSCTYTYPRGYIVTTTLWFTEIYDVENYESLLDDPDYKGRVTYRSDKTNGHTLTITNLRESDSATYKFRFITNQTGGKYFGSPGVTLSVTGVQVNVTTTWWSTTLTCSTTCTLTDNPNPTYIWYRNSKIVQQDSSPSYTVRFKTEDSFYCAVKGINSNAVLVMGQNGWSVTHTTQSICVLKGSTVELTCSYTYPSGTVTTTLWFTKWGTGVEPKDLGQDPEYAGRLVYHGDKKKDCTLRITDLRERDSATYWFRLLTDQDGGTFTGNPGVTLSVTGLQVKVTGGHQDKTLTCITTCTLTDNPTYIWYKNGQHLDESTSPQYKDPVSSNYEDSYSCAVKGHENLHSPAMCQKCWSVTYTHQSICALKGSTVDISCSYTYPSYHEIKNALWFTKWSGMDTEDLSSMPGYEGHIEYLGDKESDCTLRITDLRLNDSAGYRFRFITSGGKYSGSPVSLTITDLQVKITSSLFSRQVTLTCITTCTLTDNPTYIWYKNGNKVKEDTSRLDSDYRNTEDSFSCAVKGHGYVHSTAVCVRGQKCWSVTYPHQGVCALKGSSVDISSTYDSGYDTITSTLWFSPKQSDRWRDELIPEDLTTDPGYAGHVEYVGEKERGRSTLRITDLREEDSAEYKFIFNTQTSRWGYSFPGTTLTVTGLQVRIKDPTNIIEGKGLCLFCESICFLQNNPSYIWYKNGQRLFRHETKYLILDPVSSEDAGRYSCAVNGQEDLPSAEETLTVRYGPKVTSVSVSPSGEIVEGSSVNLTCSSDANPPVDKYTWYKKNVASPKASGQSYSITNIISEDRGEYYCEAENKYGRLNSSSVFVDVQYTTALFLWVPVMGVGAALTVGALLVTIYCYMKRRHTGGSDDTADRQSVHPDPNSDMYTSLNMKTRSPEYDTLANVRDFAVTQPSDTC